MEKKCECPDLKPKDGKCSEELIKKCHGDKATHKCEEEKK